MSFLERYILGRPLPTLTITRPVAARALLQGLPADTDGVGFDREGFKKFSEDCGHDIRAFRDLWLRAEHRSLRTQATLGLVVAMQGTVAFLPYSLVIGPLMIAAWIYLLRGIATSLAQTCDGLQRWYIDPDATPPLGLPPPGDDPTPPAPGGTVH